MALQMVRHLAHLSDEMMASQKVMEMASLMEIHLECSLADSMVTRTALLKGVHLAHLSDEMMALQKDLLKGVHLAH